MRLGNGTPAAAASPLPPPRPLPGTRRSRPSAPTTPHSALSRRPGGAGLEGKAGASERGRRDRGAGPRRPPPPLPPARRGGAKVGVEGGGHPARAPPGPARPGPPPPAPPATPAGRRLSNYRSQDGCKARLASTPQGKGPLYFTRSPVSEAHSLENGCCCDATAARSAL